MKFSYENYQELLQAGAFCLPCGFQPYISVNKVQYSTIEKEHDEKKNSYEKAFRELSRRVGKEYYWKVYPVQSRTLDYAQLAFPAYKFILPEVLAEDWLAIVDWHKFQRDHALHQPLTAYIVLKLLGFGNSNNAFKIGNESLLDLSVNQILTWSGTRYLKEYLIDMHVMDNADSDLWFGQSTLSKEMWKALFIEAACLAATFHDMGYPWQYVNILASKLRYSGGQQIESPTDDADNIIRQFGQRLIFCPLNGYHLLDRNVPATWHQRLKNLTSLSLRETHGFPGAIGFLYFNDALREFPNLKIHPIRQFCVEWAAMGIMMHDMGKIYWGDKGTESPPENPQLQLHFDIDPLGCIIALADVLEDFERPVVEFSSGDDHSIGYYSTACNSSHLEYVNGTLTIKYQMKSAKQKAKKRFYMEKEHKEYFAPNVGYLNLAAAGINKVSMESLSP